MSSANVGQRKIGSWVAWGGLLAVGLLIAAFAATKKPPEKTEVEAEKAVPVRTVVVEPAMIVGQSARGWGDLYVALTRATQQLAIVHNAELPEPLRAPAQTV